MTTLFFDGRKIIYNSYNRGIIQLDENINNIDELENTKYADYLYKKRFLVNEKDDEIKFLVNNINETMNKKSYQLDITIILTNTCNFRCVYCYQDKKDTFLSRDESKLIINNIEKLINDGIKIINVHYFGGEPALNLGELYYLHKNFLDLSQKYNITYHSHITTNGSLLNKKLLNNINFDKIQLTFDGDKEIHEKFKVSNNFGYEDLFKK